MDPYVYPETTVLRNLRDIPVELKLTAEQIEHARQLIEKGEARQYLVDLLDAGRSTFCQALPA